MGRTQGQRDFQDELTYHRREWMVQRVGWIVMALLILAALVGAFGSGPLSSVTIGHAPQATLEYERFARYATSTGLRITPALARTTADRVEPLSVEIDRSFLDDYSIVSIVPEPRSVRAAAGRYILEFELDEARPAPSADGTPDDLPRQAITIHLRPQAIGSRAGTWRIGAETLHVDQFVYP